MQSGQLAVAGGGVVGKDGVARLLSADTVAELQHLLQHVPVPHRRADEADVVFVAELMEAQIAHDRAHDGAAGEQALVPHTEAAHGHGLVAVHHVPLLVDHQASVRVAVKGNAQIVPAGGDHGGQAVQVGGAALEVDVHAVGLFVDEVGLDLEAGEEVRGRGRSGAVGAVDEHPQSAQIVLDRGGQMLDVLVFKVFHAVDPLADVPALLDGHGVRGEDLGLHPFLQCVGELVAPAVEDLDAVVLKGVVAGGDDHARVRLHLDGEVGHRRGGDGAQGHHVAARGGDAGDQRALQHVRGYAGVHADGDERRRALLLCQYQRHRLPYPVRQLRRQVLAYDPTNAVRSKKLTHNCCAPRFFSSHSFS